MKIVKVFVRPDNSATIICPACNAARSASVGRYRHAKHSLKIRCQCNAVFKVQLDFRRFYRKQTSLSGTYKVINPPGGGGGIIHIRNISHNGLGFLVSGIHHMQVGQTIQLEFRLNDKHQSRLNKQAKIRLIDKNYIGCQFINNNVVEKALGFYLRR